MANFYQDFDKRKQSTSTVAGYNLGGTHYPEPNHNMVSEYQQSGVPFVATKSIGAQTGNKIVNITLPYVSRWVFFRLAGTLSGVNIGFSDRSTSLGIQGENFISAASLNAITVPLEMKCKVIKVFVPDATNDLVIEVIAGLTNIPAFPDLDQDGISGISTTAAISATADLAAVDAVFTIVSPTT